MSKFNPHDPKDVKEAEEKANLRMLQEKEDLKWILSDPRGRRFIWKILEFCKVFNTTMTGNSYTYFNEGQRNVGLRIFDEMNQADEDAYLKMRKELKGELNDN